MKHTRISHLGTLATLWMLLCGVTSAQAAAWEIFAMDNGVGRGTWSPEKQASVLKEIGFDGISYNYTHPADLRQWLTELKSRNLRLHAVYLAAQLEGEIVVPATLAESVLLLRGSGAVLWLIVPKPSAPGNYGEEAVNRIRSVADLAATAGLRVVLYPHKGFYLATAEQALALVGRVERANVGLTVNLCHELAAGNGARLPEIIRKVAPLLELVSINGGTDRPAGNWDDYIKVLGEGTYDVPAILRTLTEINYTGPIGLQFYGVKGEPKANLGKAMRAWKALSGG